LQKQKIDLVDTRIARDKKSQPAHPVGDYRVIYAILEDDVLVLRIGHKKDVYKRES
jgi:mRNA-degrading endonuclease RelE of RelBE toxin-antitoxin system